MSCGRVVDGVEGRRLPLSPESARIFVVHPEPYIGPRTTQSSFVPSVPGDRGIGETKREGLDLAPRANPPFFSFPRA